jgi:hypothetical protein
MSGPHDNYKRCSAWIAGREWRINDAGILEDLVRQIDDGGYWIDFTGPSKEFTSYEKRRVIWRERQ